MWIRNLSPHRACAVFSGSHLQWLLVAGQFEELKAAFTQAARFVLHTVQYQTQLVGFWYAGYLTQPPLDVLMRKISVYLYLYSMETSLGKLGRSLKPMQNRLYHTALVVVEERWWGFQRGFDTYESSLESKLFPIVGILNSSGEISSHLSLILACVHWF